MSSPLQTILGLFLIALSAALLALVAIVSYQARAGSRDSHTNVYPHEPGDVGPSDAGRHIGRRADALPGDHRASDG